MALRKKTPKEREQGVLTRSKRRCPLCYGLQNDLEIKRGQIAHVDHNHANSDEDNLVFLCLKHHDEFDSSTSQSKGITASEVRLYRKKLYAELARRSIGDETKDIRAQQREALIEVLGDMVPDALASLNAGAVDCADTIHEVKKLHKRFERVRPLFQDRPDVQEALTRIGNLTGSSISPYFPRVPQTFEVFERDVHTLEKALKELSA